MFCEIGQRIVCLSAKKKLAVIHSIDFFLQPIVILNFFHLLFQNFEFRVSPDYK
jgi:hypothetical protein